MTVIDLTVSVKTVKDDGPVTVGTRAQLATTSWASKLLPSWNFTSGRSLISHWSSAIGFQLTARAGIRWRWASTAIRLSNSCPEITKLGARLW
jgi:hypothetical protein